MNRINKPAPEFFRSEIRCDFLVDEKRKKVWAAEMEMLQRFDQVCQKYGFTYWVLYGTLLGAVRHQGFIPWDDDIDVVMFRDEYERFQAVAPQEFTEPYFFQNSYTDRIVWPFSKIRDSRTTAIEFRNYRDINQGIFIDIFPLDSVPEDDNQEIDRVFETQKLLWNLVTNPREVLLKVKQDLIEGKNTLEEVQILLDISKRDIKERFRVFEDFNLEHFGRTREVNYIMGEIMGTISMKKEWFRDKIYLPFEHIQVPVPIDYEKLLVKRYGDYHQMIRGRTEHEGIIMDPDIPYDEYFAKYF